MQYCYLQQTLLSPPDTFTTEHCFCFGPAASFFLKLLLIVIVLCSSPEAYWRPSDLGVWAFFFRSNIYIYIYLPFHTIHGVLLACTGVDCHFLLQEKNIALCKPRIEPAGNFVLASKAVGNKCLLLSPPGLWHFITMT